MRTPGHDEPQSGGVHAPIPIDETDRLMVLRSFGVLDSAPQVKFVELARLAAEICGVPMAFVSVVDREREFFLAAVGSDLTESPRDISFCGHTILGEETLVVADALADPRFAENPNVIGGPRVRFYAGVPLISREGQALGALCVKDTAPHELTDGQLSALRVLGRQVAAQLELQRQLAESQANERELAASAAELRTIARELRASHELYRALLERSPDLVWLVELDGTIRIASDSHQTLLGYSPEELVGSPIAMLSDPVEVEGFFELVSQALTGAELPPRRMRMRCKDGSVLMVETRFVLIESADHDAPFVLAVSRDLTSRVSLEEKYRQAERMETIGLLTGSIVHDFNNLLVPMLGYAGLALSQIGEDQRELRSQIEQIEAAGEQARDLIRRLLAAARPQVKMREALSLDEVVTTALPLVRMLLGKAVEVEHVPTARLPLCIADPSSFNQVLLNLAANTRDALPAAGGRVTISTGVRTLDAREAEPAGLPTGDYVTLAFSDDGPGIDAATKARIFEPFFTTKPEYGTGLGLATVQQIVRESGGTIDIESSLGHGTTFIISLPVA